MLNRMGRNDFKAPGSKHCIKLSKKLLLQNVKRRNFSKKYFYFHGN